MTLISSLFLIAFAASILVGLLILWTRSWHGKFSFDTLLGIQKVHHDQVPRVGGIAVLSGFAIAGQFLPEGIQEIFKPTLVLGFTALSFGLLEDLTKQVSVTIRLWATMIPAVIGYLLTGYTLHQFGIEWVDWILQWTVISIAFTAFAVCGMTQAINIVDGFNGLASWAAFWILVGIISLSLSANDVHLAIVAGILLASMIGFLLINWPWGKLFLGDGGAYLLGASIAWLCVTLVNRNPQISPFACLVLCAYPIIEVLYSIARRLKAKMHTGSPDSQHLHQLLSKLLFPERAQRARWQNNAIIGFLCGSFSIIPMVLASQLYQDQVLLMGIFVVLVLLYIATYKLISRKIAQRRRLKLVHPELQKISR